MKCSHDPTKNPLKLEDQTIDHYNCPECGVLVVKGLPHPEVCDHGEHKETCDICCPNWDDDIGLFDEDALDEPF